MTPAELSKYLAKEEADRLLAIGDAAATENEEGVVAGVAGLISSAASQNPGLGTLAAGTTSRLLGAGSYAKANRAILEAYARDAKEERIQALADLFSMLITGAQANLRDDVGQLRDALLGMREVQSEHRRTALEHHERVVEQLVSVLSEVRALEHLSQDADDARAAAERPAHGFVDGNRGGLFISYAWGVDDGFIDELEESLSRAGFELHRDKRDVGYGESITKFMDHLGDSELVLVVISDKYLRSPYCVGELLSIYRSQEKASARESKDRFQRTILPIVLPDAKSAWEVPKNLEYIKHWTGQAELVTTALRDYQTVFAEERYAEFRKIIEFREMIDSLLKFVGELNTMSVEALAADDFKLVREAVAERLAGLNGSRSSAAKKKRTNKQAETSSSTSAEVTHSPAAPQTIASAPYGDPSVAPSVPLGLWRAKDGTALSFGIPLGRRHVLLASDEAPHTLSLDGKDIRVVGHRWSHPRCAALQLWEVDAHLEPICLTKNVAKGLMQVAECTTFELEPSAWPSLEAIDGVIMDEGDGLRVQPSDESQPRLRIGSPVERGGRVAGIVVAEDELGLLVWPLSSLRANSALHDKLGLPLPAAVKGLNRRTEELLRRSPAFAGAIARRLHLRPPDEAGATPATLATTLVEELGLHDVLAAVKAEAPDHRAPAKRMAGLLIPYAIDTEEIRTNDVLRVTKHAAAEVAVAGDTHRACVFVFDADLGEQKGDSAVPFDAELARDPSQKGDPYAGWTKGLLGQLAHELGLSSQASRKQIASAGLRRHADARKLQRQFDRDPGKPPLYLVLVAKTANEEDLLRDFALQLRKRDPKKPLESLGWLETVILRSEIDESESVQHLVTEYIEPIFEKE